MLTISFLLKKNILNSKLQGQLFVNSDEQLLLYTWSIYSWFYTE